jgi:hypothetical protein
LRDKSASGGRGFIQVFFFLHLQSRSAPSCSLPCSFLSSLLTTHTLSLLSILTTSLSVSLCSLLSSLSLSLSLSRSLAHNTPITKTRELALIDMCVCLAHWSTTYFHVSANSGVRFKSLSPLSLSLSQVFRVLGAVEVVGGYRQTLWALV